MDKEAQGKVINAINDYAECKISAEKCAELLGVNFYELASAFNRWAKERSPKLPKDKPPLLSEAVGWIRIRDRLPVGYWNINRPWLSKEVLIANSCSINIGFYNRNNGMWYVDEPAKKEWIDKITHWMPLPVNPHQKAL